MKLLIDASILLDVLQNRAPYCEESALIWKLCETEVCLGSVSALTITNLVYIMRKELTPEKTEEILCSLKLIFEFVDLSGADITHAAKRKWPDFEDALQSVTAERIGADYIVTRNVRDYDDSPVPACTPLKLLDQLYFQK